MPSAKTTELQLDVLTMEKQGRPESEKASGTKSWSKQNRV